MRVGLGGRVVAKEKSGIRVGKSDPKVSLMSYGVSGLTDCKAKLPIQ